LGSRKGAEAQRGDKVLSENEAAREVVDAAYRIHKTWEPGSWSRPMRSPWSTPLLTYLRLTGVRLGLLVNFGAEPIRQGVRRIANGMP